MHWSTQNVTTQQKLKTVEDREIKEISENGEKGERIKSLLDPIQGTRLHPATNRIPVTQEAKATLPERFQVSRTKKPSIEGR